ncbi:MAG: hypothetical protein E7470_03955 [Ruminococcaceae bacterium]|nr:hypothetical protein [Oscillospiraceae bacterium]
MTERIFCKTHPREVAVGASHGGCSRSVAPEPERRTRKLLDLSRASCVSAAGKLPMSGICESRCNLSGTAG